jgi:hypothetical protein
MSKIFRFLVAEDIYVEGAKQWVTLNLPGSKDPNICKIDVVDCFVEGWKRIMEESPPYDGFIFDMDLSFVPGGSPELYRDYPQTNISPQWPEYRKYINHQEHITTGGLWLWAWAGKRYEQGAPPTIFFTGHGDQFSQFLGPMDWAGTVFWCSKNFQARDEKDKARAAGVVLHGDKVIVENWDDILNNLSCVLMEKELEDLDEEHLSMLSALLAAAVTLPLSTKERMALVSFLSTSQLPAREQLEERLVANKPRIFEGSNQDVTNHDIFRKFLDAVRSRLFRSQFFPEFAQIIKGVAPGTLWSDLSSLEEEERTLASIFPEHDFSEAVPLSEKDRVYIESQLHQESQIRLLNRLFSGESSPLSVLVHPYERNWDPRKVTNYPACLAPLHQDIREAIASLVDQIIQADGDQAKTLAKAAGENLREPHYNSRSGSDGLYIPKVRRDKISASISGLRENFCDKRTKLHWRDNIQGYARSGTTLDNLKSQITERLKDGGGEIFRLTDLCRGFFITYCRVYLPDGRSAWRRNLSERYGDWWPEKDMVVEWDVPEDRLPVQISLVPLI